MSRFSADTVERVKESADIVEIISDYDVILDGADNFPTRYLLNDASVRLRKPVVSASILILTANYVVTELFFSQ